MECLLHIKKANNSKIYAHNILKSINDTFGNLKPIKIIIEPGRFLVADAGVIETEVIWFRWQENRKKMGLY